MERKGDGGLGKGVHELHPQACRSEDELQVYGEDTFGAKGLFRK